ncbi:hypothetical protein Gohar_020140 [Gossypium harknessii]|uniref:SFR19-like C-terminal domain-containing protein n=1 Tax=Gossypium harknessii TaxID=34285 RepID=A0A7J9HWR1_9ROSI|nr:hypothetical protein [Gossypium harknessii]
MSVDNLSQRSHLKLREHSGESLAVDSSIFTKAWVDNASSEGIKDCHAIERWQSQAVAADPDFFHPTNFKDEEDSNASSRQTTWKHDGRANESSISQVSVNKERFENHPHGTDRIKQAVVDYVASLLMPLYKARKIDKEGYKSIMKKTATKVMEQATDAEKNMAVSEFLDFKRKNKTHKSLSLLKVTALNYDDAGKELYNPQFMIQVSLEPKNMIQCFTIWIDPQRKEKVAQIKALLQTRSEAVPEYGRSILDAELVSLL